MNPRHIFSAIFIFALLFLTSCTPSRVVIYSLNNISLTESVQTIPINVDVKTLKDNRIHTEDNILLFNSNYPKVFIQDSSYCVNAEKYYKTEPVVSQITQLMVKHFNKAKLFTHASYNENTDSDYYLTGTLNSFYGKQKFSGGSSGAVAGAVAAGLLFGVIGGAIAGGIAGATMNTKSSGKIVIEISDLKLFRKNGTLIKDFGSFYKEYEGDFEADAECWCIYSNVNSKLKDFNTELIEKIRAELLGIIP
jgi:hypothetical protein